MLTQVVEAQVDEWITAKKAAEILGIQYMGVKYALFAGKVRRREIPGTAIRYHLGDVEQLLAASITREGDAEAVKRDHGRAKTQATGDSLPANPAARARRQKTA